MASPTKMGPPKDIKPDEWSAFSPSFKKMANAGPGVWAAKAANDIVDPILAFSRANYVMDLGCGLGQVMAQVLADYGALLPKVVKLVAADTSQGMLEQVRKRQKEEVDAGNAIWERIETPLWNALDLADVPDGAVSHFLSGFVYWLFPDSRRAFTEALRVMRPESEGGSIFAATSLPSAEWLHAMSFITEVRPDKIIPGFPAAWRTEENLVGEMKAVGFNNVQAHTFPVYMPFQDHTAIATWIMTSFPILVQYSKDMTKEEIQQTTDLMAAYFKEKHPDAGPGWLEGTALLGIGQK